eukprot:3879424-Pleurochrysis_carterae.AAC.1
MEQADAFLGILRVFFQLAAPSTIFGENLSDAETFGFLRDGERDIGMKLENKEHLATDLSTIIIPVTFVGLNDYYLSHNNANNLLAAFAIR